MNRVFVYTLLSLAIISFSACSNEAEETVLEAEELLEDTTENLENRVDIKEVLKQGYSEADAITLFHEFMRVRYEEYEDYGTLEDVSAVGGNYNDKGGLDYFYTAIFYPGGDFMYPKHFFYHDHTGKIVELSFQDAVDNIYSVSVDKMEKGYMIGSATLLGAFSGEHFASKEAKVDFSIQDDAIIFSPESIEALIVANGELEEELEAMWEE